VSLFSTLHSSLRPGGVADYTGISSNAAFRSLEDRLVVRVTGEDRVPFLHGMCSNDIKGLAPDAIVPALFLTERAHLIADCYIWNTANDVIFIELERTRWPRLREHLERLLVADDVDMAETGMAVLDLEGPRSHDIAAELIGSALPPSHPWHHAFTARIWIGNLPRLDIPAYSIMGDPVEIEGIAQALRESGIPQADPQGLEAIRVENGIARVGVDTNDKTIALEARLERAISFSKGCYLGQETIERATARGALKKRLFGLRIHEGVPAAGSLIKLDGKEVGQLTSVAVSPRFGTIGLSILHHSAWQEGLAVIVADSAGEHHAEVNELPFK
jgi:folate-binding protein YgfZ